MSASTKEGVVLSAGQQPVIEELQRHDGEQVRPARSPRSRPKTPVAFVVLWWVSVLTVIVGPTRPGLGMAFAVGFGWVLWRYLPELGNVLESSSDVDDDGDNPDPHCGGRP
jgi:hypothetical protein